MSTVAEVVTYSCSQTSQPLPCKGDLDQRYIDTHRYTPLPQNLQPWNLWHQALPGTSVLVKPAASAAVIAASRRRWSSPCTALESSSRYSEVATLKIYESHESPIAEKSPDLGFQPQPLLLWSWPWFLRPEESRKCLQNAEKRKSTCASLVKRCQMPDT